MKKASLTLFVLGLFYLNSYSTLHTMDFDDDDDFDISCDLDNMSLDNLEPVKMNLTRAGNYADAWAAAILFLDAQQPGSIYTLLDSSVYIKTSDVRNRPILEYPFALTYGFDLRNQSVFSVFGFFNKSYKKNFTKNSQFLDSYFAIDDRVRLDVLQEISDSLGSKFDLEDTLALFGPAGIEERRVGGLLQMHVVRDKCNINLQLPVLYAERNLQLSDAQQAVIASSEIAEIWESDANQSSETFKYKHFVLDQWGVGDLKIKAMYELHRSNKFDIDLGGFLIFPTAGAIQKGVVGTWFNQTNDRAYLDLTTINPNPEIPLTQQSQDNIAQFFLAAMDKLSSNILHCPLGNKGHFVMAASTNFDWYFSRNWKLSSDQSIQVPLPAQEQRFYKNIQTLEDFNAAFDIAMNDAENLMIFVNQEFQNIFFPYVFTTRVFPGVVLNSTNRFIFNHNAWDFHVGANFWYQGREYLKIPKMELNQYDVEAASASSAYQEKILGQVSYRVERENYFWSLGLYGDITIWNSGIGNDYTAGVNLDCRF